MDFSKLPSSYFKYLALGYPGRYLRGEVTRRNDSSPQIPYFVLHKDLFSQPEVHVMLSSEQWSLFGASSAFTVSGYPVPG
eukprot:3935646-Rhodomonas_salina.1